MSLNEVLEELRRPRGRKGLSDHGQSRQSKKQGNCCVILLFLNSWLMQQRSNPQLLHRLVDLRLHIETALLDFLLEWERNCDILLHASPFFLCGCNGLAKSTLPHLERHFQQKRWNLKWLLCNYSLKWSAKLQLTYMSQSIFRNYLKIMITTFWHNDIC